MPVPRADGRHCPPKGEGNAFAFAAFDRLQRLATDVVWPRAIGASARREPRRRLGCHPCMAA
jgi:hypothetical protein